MKIGFAWFKMVVNKTKERVKVEGEKTYWHPAFCGITEWELKKNRDDLFFDPEFQLSKKPIQMDMLVIKKNSSAVIENEIGKLFKKHNIFVFKGSGAGEGAWRTE